MKRFLAVVFCIALCICASGCGKKAASGRVLYNTDLSKYVKLGEYEKIPVDMSSDTMDGYKKDIISSDVENGGYYVQKTSGTVADGDTVNIDYVGKKDGVAFSGGTASGYDLEIGSNSFIDGFESGLIGVNIGDTVDLNLTFPEGYQSEELAGQAVVFTVTVNYVKTSEEMKPEDFYSQMGFESLDKYNEDVEDRAVKKYLVDTVCANSKIKKYPDTDIDTIYNAYKNTVETNLKNNNATLSDYLSYNNMTEAQFKDNAVSNQIKPLMDTQLVMYAILDATDNKVTSEDVDKKISDTVNSYNSSGITADTLENYYGRYYFEYLTVDEMVTDYLYKNAVIEK